MSAMSWSPEPMIDRIGGDSVLARELVALFLADYPRMLAALRESIRAGGADGVRRAAHAFKGSIANFVEEGPMETAFEIEQLAKAGRVGDAAPLVSRLEDEVAWLVDGMRDFEKRAPRCES